MNPLDASSVEIIAKERWQEEEGNIDKCMMQYAVIAVYPHKFPLNRVMIDPYTAVNAFKNIARLETSNREIKVRYLPDFLNTHKEA